MAIWTAVFWTCAISTPFEECTYNTATIVGRVPFEIISSDQKGCEAVATVFARNVQEFLILPTDEYTIVVCNKER